MIEFFSDYFERKRWEKDGKKKETTITCIWSEITMELPQFYRYIM